eukprot:TRINITY_DN29470_c0_g1_i1.p1 TRINITY_DN29470_c0_g1~~TRINITY_DN29470_c0_g1_i1.p1  ORF type:complete len:204 (-),score=21.59 TRINITY_DN29470_c0_g1_i1:217-828(-)
MCSCTPAEGRLAASACAVSRLGNIGPGALHNATAAFMCLRLLSPRLWWRLRELSAGWRCLLDGELGNEFPLGLIAALVATSGPLRTANDEIDFAGCVYTAVHHGSTGPLQLLLRPLADNGWARQSFAIAVAREALTQAAVAGDAASCRAVLATRGPAAPVGSRLSKADAAHALEAAEEWEAMSPGSTPACQREAVGALLRAVC